jgi:DNA-binding beta-propeller fold protein YncE
VASYPLHFISANVSCHLFALNKLIDQIMSRKFISSIVLIIIISHLSIEAQMNKLWETGEIFKAPESVVYDQKRGLLYVSNYTRKMRDGLPYGDCFVSKVNKNGEIINYNWISNLTSPTGLYLFNDMLYIVERFGIVEYDLNIDKVNNKFFISQTSLLNDVTVDIDSNIYVTDSKDKTIYRIKNGEIIKWMDTVEINYPNGIEYDEGKLIIVTNGDNYLKSIDIKTKEIHNIAYLGEGLLDGVKKCTDGYLVSNYYGILLLVEQNGTAKELLNTKDQNIPCADFEFINNEQMIIIPTLWNNKLYGYKYNPE